MRGCLMGFRVVKSSAMIFSWESYAICAKRGERGIVHFPDWPLKNKSTKTTHLALAWIHAVSYCEYKIDGLFVKFLGGESHWIGRLDG